ncbi:MAG: response regulator transcription factor [Nitriliruptorales bacterium]|nr:response regulator transcription factor [Nitriliruptorales bacterium]
MATPRETPSGEVTTGGANATAADAPSTTVTVVVADDRPVLRAGLRAVLEDDTEVKAAVDFDTLVETVEREQPDVLVLTVRENDPDPFRVVATVKGLRPATGILIIGDGASVVDLREAVIAGVDSYLLTNAPPAEIVAAVEATAAGERKVSPEVAMQLAGAWKHEPVDNEGTSLTPRELEVLQLLAEGLTNAQIGERLNLSSRTIKTHVQNLLSKLDVPDRTGAVGRGFRLGLIR